MVVAVLIGITIYIYAGWVISEITFELLGEIEPEHLWNYHKSLNAVWGIDTTKLILKMFIVFFWSIFYFVKKI